MSELRFCPKCHKVFYWELIIQVETLCPNCSDGRYYHGAVSLYNDDIILQKLTFPLNE